MTGAVASKKATEAREGGLRLVGNQLAGARAKARLTVRETSRAETKVGPNDQVVLCGKAIAQRTKATLGITG